MRVVWPWTSWGCFPGCCALVYFFYSYNSSHYIYKLPNKICLSLGFSQGILSTHVNKAICEGRTVTGLCEIWGSAVASLPSVGHATFYCISFPAHVTSVIRQTAESRSRVVITPYLWSPGFNSHPKTRLTEFLWFPPSLQANADYPMTGSFHIPVFFYRHNYHSTLYTPTYL